VAEQNIAPAESAADAGTAEPRRFLVFATVSLALPLIALVPEHRGRW
jgi:hypothetical protein